MRSQLVWSAAVFGFIAPAVLVAQTATFTPLGYLPGLPGSIGSAVSADGSVVVGSANLTPVVGRAFRWTQAEGMVEIGPLPPGTFGSGATAISADGSVIAGYVNLGGAFNNEAFRWTSQTGIVRLGSSAVSAFPTTPSAISADGNVIVGTDYDGVSERAFRWTASTGCISIASNGVAFDISDDGVTVVGEVELAGPFRWTEAGGLILMGGLPGGSSEGSANACSADGSVIGGFTLTDAGMEAFRWTVAGGMVSLGDLPGGLVSSRVGGMSDDGEILVGVGRNDLGATAFIWNRYHGMRSLASVLRVTFGIDLTGWALFEANAISADGRVIVGTAIDPAGNDQAWRVTIPRPCAADVTRDYRVDLDDLARLLSNFGLESGARQFQGDVNLDGAVDLTDLSLLLSSFGVICE